VPLDMATILDSVRKTGRLVLVDQATRHASAAAVMFAIDYPYQTTEAAVRFLDEAEISDEDRRKIYHRNAERIFGIPDCEEPTDVEY
jgi:predicted TIM-barrel fold metal-dependent hydrolase